ncbi:MAG: hypothetical protein QF492_08370 [Candidatus Krumholzibacteria bacterium]|jgi:hypothetical protein|nr:hypothetical protein [Candidatus Krumholzibacteria bacterium]MDP6669902.1 hypothetical protein [Candidatus Krumholzibacteria bacterium]MDP6797169.1 hypothetical protein [Candidatus Krumholzibacteria bacterium]MDP7020896.1 hypothetical protein [Candidatus Krumholzibacteria bacterium]
MTRLILMGTDHELLSLLTRLRMEGRAEILGIIPLGQDEDLRLYAEISGLPILRPDHCPEWAGIADYLVVEQAPTQAWGGLPRLLPSEVQNRFFQEETEVSIPPKEERRASPPARSSFPAFARELRREILRSQRYHLGFCLSLFLFLDEEQNCLQVSHFQEEPLLNLPAEIGRKTDTWGLSPEGVMLHLAPETLEQSRLLKRRLQSALEDCTSRLEGGPWKVLVVQSLFPQDGNSASLLIRKAMEQLARKGYTPGGKV